MKIEARLCLAIALAVAGSAAFAQGWAPQKNIEIVAGSAPGGIWQISISSSLFGVAMNASCAPRGEV